MMSAVIGSLAERTGRSLEEWLALVDPRGIDEGEPFFERAPGAFGQRPDHRAHHVVGRRSHPASLTSHGCPDGRPEVPWADVPPQASGSVTRVVLHQCAGIRPGFRTEGSMIPRAHECASPKLARRTGRCQKPGAG